MGRPLTGSVAPTARGWRAEVPEAADRVVAPVGPVTQAQARRWCDAAVAALGSGSPVPGPILPPMRRLAARPARPPSPMSRTPGIWYVLGRARKPSAASLSSTKSPSSATTSPDPEWPSRSSTARPRRPAPVGRNSDWTAEQAHRRRPASERRDPRGVQPRRSRRQEAHPRRRTAPCAGRAGHPADVVPARVRTPSPVRPRPAQAEPGHPSPGRPAVHRAARRARLRFVADAAHRTQDWRGLRPSRRDYLRDPERERALLVPVEQGGRTYLAWLPDGGIGKSMTQTGLKTDASERAVPVGPVAAAAHRPGHRHLQHRPDDWRRRPERPPRPRPPGSGQRAGVPPHRPREGRPGPPPGRCRRDPHPGRGARHGRPPHEARPDQPARPPTPIRPSTAPVPRRAA